MAEPRALNPYNQTPVPGIRQPVVRPNDRPSAQAPSSEIPDFVDPLDTYTPSSGAPAATSPTLPADIIDQSQALYPQDKTGSLGSDAFIGLTESGLMNGQNVSWLLVNFSGVKWINDHWGHEAGNAYLLRVKAILEEVIGAPVQIVRQGPNFAVLLPETIDAAAVMQRLEERLSSGVDFAYTRRDRSGGVEIIPASYSTATEGRQRIFNQEVLVYDATQQYSFEAVFAGLREEIYYLNGPEREYGRYTIPQIIGNGYRMVVLDPQRLSTLNLDERLVGREIPAYREDAIGSLTEDRSGSENVRALEGDALNLLLESGRIQLAVIDLNAIGAFRSLGPLGDLMIDAVLEVRVLEAAQVLDGTGITLYRHGGGSEEYYLAGDVTEEQMANATRQFLEALNAEPLVLRVEVSDLESTAMGRRTLEYLKETGQYQPYQHTFENGQSAQVVDVDLTRVTRGILQPDGSYKTFIGLTGTAATGEIRRPADGEVLEIRPEFRNNRFGVILEAFARGRDAVMELVEQAKPNNPNRDNLIVKAGPYRGTETMFRDRAVISPSSPTPPADTWPHPENPNPWTDEPRMAVSQAQGRGPVYRSGSLGGVMAPMPVAAPVSTPSVNDLYTRIMSIGPMSLIPADIAATYSPDQISVAVEDGQIVIEAHPTGQPVGFRIKLKVYPEGGFIEVADVDVMMTGGVGESNFVAQELTVVNRLLEGLRQIGAASQGAYQNVFINGVSSYYELYALAWSGFSYVGDETAAAQVRAQVAQIENQVLQAIVDGRINMTGDRAQDLMAINQYIIDNNLWPADLQMGGKITADAIPPIRAEQWAPVAASAVPSTPRVPIEPGQTMIYYYDSTWFYSVTMAADGQSVTLSNNYSTVEIHEGIPDIGAGIRPFMIYLKDGQLFMADQSRLPSHQATSNGRPLQMGETIIYYRDAIDPTIDYQAGIAQQMHLPGTAEVSYLGYKYTLLSLPEGHIQITRQSPSGEIVNLGELGLNENIGPFFAGPNGVVFFPYEASTQGISLLNPGPEAVMPTLPAASPQIVASGLPAPVEAVRYDHGLYTATTYMSLNRYLLSVGRTPSWVSVNLDLGPIESELSAEARDHIQAKIYERLWQIAHDAGIRTPIIILNNNGFVINVPDILSAEVQLEIVDAINQGLDSQFSDIQLIHNADGGAVLNLIQIQAADAKPVNLDPQRAYTDAEILGALDTTSSIEPSVTIVQIPVNAEGPELAAYYQQHQRRILAAVDRERALGMALGEIVLHSGYFELWSPDGELLNLNGIMMEYPAGQLPSPELRQEILTAVSSIHAAGIPVGGILVKDGHFMLTATDGGILSIDGMPVSLNGEISANFDRGSLIQAWGLANGFNLNPIGAVVHGDGSFEIELDSVHVLDLPTLKNIKDHWDVAVSYGLEPQSVNVLTSHFEIVDSSGEVIDLVSPEPSSGTTPPADNLPRPVNPYPFNGDVPRVASGSTQRGGPVYRSGSPDEIVAPLPSSPTPPIIVRDGEYRRVDIGEGVLRIANVGGRFMAAYGGTESGTELTWSPLSPNGEVIFDQGRIAVKLGPNQEIVVRTSDTPIVSQPTAETQPTAPAPQPSSLSRFVYESNMEDFLKTPDFKSHAVPVEGHQEISVVVDNATGRIHHYFREGEMISPTEAVVTFRLAEDGTIAEVIFHDPQLNFLKDGFEKMRVDYNNSLNPTANYTGLLPMSPISFGSPEGVEAIPAGSLPTGFEAELNQIRNIDPQLADILETHLRGLGAEERAALSIDITDIRDFRVFLEKVQDGEVPIENGGVASEYSDMVELLNELGINSENEIFSQVTGQMFTLRLTARYGNGVAGIIFSPNGVDFSDFSRGQFKTLMNAINKAYLGNSSAREYLSQIYTEEQVLAIEVAVANKEIKPIEDALASGQQLTPEQIAHFENIVKIMQKPFNADQLAAFGGQQRLDALSAQVEAARQAAQTPAADNIVPPIDIKNILAQEFGLNQNQADRVMEILNGQITTQEQIVAAAEQLNTELTAMGIDISTFKVRIQQVLAGTLVNAASINTNILARLQRSISSAISAGRGFSKEVIQELFQEVEGDAIIQVTGCANPAFGILIEFAVEPEIMEMFLTGQFSEGLSAVRLTTTSMGAGIAGGYATGWLARRAGLSADSPAMLPVQIAGGVATQLALMPILRLTGGRFLPNFGNAVVKRLVSRIGTRLGSQALARGGLAALCIAGNLINLAGWALMALNMKSIAQDLALFLASNDPDFQDNMRYGWAIRLYRHRNDPDAANYWAMPDIGQSDNAVELAEINAGASEEERIAAMLYVDEQIETLAQGVREQLMSTLQLKLVQIYAENWEAHSSDPNFNMSQFNNMVMSQLTVFMDRLNEPVSFSAEEQPYVERIEEELASGHGTEEIISNVLSWQESAPNQMDYGLSLIIGNAPTMGLGEQGVRAILEKLLIQKIQGLWEQVQGLHPIFTSNSSHANYDLESVPFVSPLTGMSGANAGPVVGGESLYDVFMADSGMDTLIQTGTNIFQARMQILLSSTSIFAGGSVELIQPAFGEQIVLPIDIESGLVELVGTDALGNATYRIKVDHPAFAQAITQMKDNPDLLLSQVLRLHILNGQAQNGQTSAFNAMDIALGLVDEQGNILTDSETYQWLEIFRKGFLTSSEANRLPSGIDLYMAYQVASQVFGTNIPLTE